METTRLEPAGKVDYAVANLKGKKNYDWLRNISNAVYKISLPETVMHLYADSDLIKLVKVTPRWRDIAFKVSADAPGAECLMMKALQNSLQKIRCLVVSPALEDKLEHYLPNFQLQKLF